MLLRTFLLLLCVSSSLCATLGLFHMQAKDEDTPPQDTALDNAVDAVIENLQEKEDDLPKETPQHEVEKNLDNGNDKQPEDDIAVQAVTVEDAARAEEVVKVQAVTVEDAAPAEEVVKVQAVTVEDAAPAEEVVKVQAVTVEDAAPAEEVVKVQAVTVEDAAPAEEVVKVQAVTVEDAAPAENEVKVQTVTVEDVAPAEEVVETDSDKKADKTLEENVIASQEQEQLPQEEDNEIKPVQTKEVPKPVEQSRWGLNSIRSGFQNMNGYFDSLVELVGGRNGVCQYRCRYGQIPTHRPGYQLPEPNGCSSSLVGFQLDLGIPAMTQCCNQLDSCYDSCGTSKYDCDSSFRTCLHSICSDLKKSLGLGAQYQACESMADGLFNTVWTLGCRPYMNSQRAACICEEEEKDEL